MLHSGVRENVLPAGLKAEGLSGVPRDAMRVIQFNLRAFFSVRTWPWMMLFYKLRPMLRSAQVEKELATLNEDFSKLKDAFDRSVSACPNRQSQSSSPRLFSLHFPPRCEIKRREAEDRQVVLVQEKNDLTLQLQAVRDVPLET